MQDGGKRGAFDAVVQTDLDVVDDAQVTEQPDVLERPCDSGFVDLHRVHSVSVLTVEENRPGCWLINFRKQVEDRSLARAVWAD